MPAIDKAKARALWLACLASAFRTGLACSIVGCVTLLGPPSVQRLIGFPAFSYVSVILIIINDASLGDTLRACWLSLYASIQTIGPAILSLWLIGPNRFSKATISLAVALAAFVVALPAESTHSIAKRIALGQIMIVYVIAYVNGVQTVPIMHPLRVAASTAIGVLVCVLALLLPYPRLACHQVKQNYKLLTQNTLERLKLLVKAVCEEDKTSALASISHAKFLATSRTKLLLGITRYQEGMQWERPPIKFFRPHYWSRPGEILGDIETSLRGMELALRNTNSFPVSIPSEELKHGLNKLEEHVSLTLKQAQQILHGGSLTVPEPSGKSITKFLQSLHTIPANPQDLPICFFLFCAKLIHETSLTEPLTRIQDKPVQKNGNGPEGKRKSSNWAESLRSPKVIRAFKCSLSLGLAVLLGLIYSKENGIWSGLPLAISFVWGREATFSVANLKAQGTVIGSVYGVLSCFVLERFLPIRFLSLLPWFFFTSFLQRSQMYGPAGGISAVIGAVLILGRKNIGPPSEFAIARIIEIFIGLSCSILVDLLFEPKRASTCAKNELSQSLASLHVCIGSFSFLTGKTYSDENKKLRLQVNELRKFVVEAEQEPNFWFLPFHSACYRKLLNSFSNLVDLFHFGAQALKYLEKEIHGDHEASWKEAVSGLESELGHLKELICSSLKTSEEICRMKSLRFLEKEVEKNDIACDLELGKSQKSNISVVSCLGEDEIEKVVVSYLEVSTTAVDSMYGGEGEGELKSRVVLSLSALGFCLTAFLREIMAIEGAIEELVRWENPSCVVNFYDISCKLHVLRK